ncbi:MAG: hypothetical protein AAGJ80_01380 [Cyanobacteria bacterium J06553_1]
MAEETVDFRLENDSCMIISGPSKSGKTSFVIELLRRKENLFRHPIRSVYWFHGAAQSTVHDRLCREMGVVMKQGTPTEDDFEPVQQYDLVVLDDLQNEMKSDSHITSLFLKQSHHRQFFVILLQQNIYGDKEQRYRNANAHYWIGFHNPRNQRQVSEFLSRMFASGGKRAIEGIFKHILETEGNYGYLFVDFTPNMRADLRLRSHIFTSPMHIYKVNERGGFNDWLALSTLQEEAGSNMSYDKMVLIPKARYQSLVGGARKSDVKALLEPKKAYAEEVAREVLDFTITPGSVTDYYTKLSQFNKIRRDFFLPKGSQSSPPPPPKQLQEGTTTTPAATPVVTPTPPFMTDLKKKESTLKRLKHLRQLAETSQQLKRLPTRLQRKILMNEPLAKLKRLPSRLRGDQLNNRFQEYGQLFSA